MAITVFLSRSPGVLNRGPGGPASLGAGFLYRILFPTDWTSCAQSYIIVRQPPSSCGRHKSHSFNPSTVKVIFWYSSTGCTCYLHRCISYFDTPVGSEVNIQQRDLEKIELKWKWIVRFTFGLVVFYSISTFISHLIPNAVYTYIYIYIYIYIYMCVCVCVINKTY